MLQEESGDIKICRFFPTVVGNKNLDAYNNQIREQIYNYTNEDVNRIALKRTVGMGDVILVEPVIRFLKNKYPLAKIDLYTAKKDIVSWFESKPDSIIEIDQNSILQDILADKYEYNLRYDLDLSYESRNRTSFIDAYFETLGEQDISYEDKQVHLLSKDIVKKDKFAVVCADGSGWPGKTWGMEKYAQAIKFLQNKGWEVVETGSECTDLTDAKYHNCSLETMVETIAKSSLYVGTDNGPMHVARSFNIPCIVIAGAALPFYSNPNREHIFYLQNNNSESLGCKHDMFFSLNNNSLTFIPTPENDAKSGLDSITFEHFKMAYSKMFTKIDSTIENVKMDFYFNIPGYSYYISENRDLDFIQIENVLIHPDQEKDLSEEYAPRYEEILNTYAIPWVERIKKQKESGKLLDIGCNIGCTVKAALDAGYDAYGFDINEGAIKKGKQLFPEIADRLFDSDTGSYKYDIITCDQTIEHVEDPIKFLNEIKSMLNDDGILVIGAPNFRSKQASKEWHKWGQTGKGEHTLLLTPNSLDAILSFAGFDYISLVDAYETGGFVICATKEMI